MARLVVLTLLLAASSTGGAATPKTMSEWAADCERNTYLCDAKILAAASLFGDCDLQVPLDDNTAKKVAAWIRAQVPNAPHDDRGYFHIEAAIAALYPGHCKVSAERSAGAASSTGSAATPKTMSDWAVDCERKTRLCEAKILITASQFGDCDPKVPLDDNTAKQVATWIRAHVPNAPADNGFVHIEAALAALYPGHCKVSAERSAVEVIKLPAASFSKAENVAAGAKACGGSAYGASVILNAPPCRPAKNATEYRFTAPAAGRYQLMAEYAAFEARPVRILLNGVLVNSQALATSTGCWEESCQLMLPQGVVRLAAGTNTMRVERDSYFPHIRRFRFWPMAAVPIPQPKLAFAGTEDYQAGGAQWTRYMLRIDNRSEFPTEMLAPAPSLPPCGLDKNASRSWIDIYDGNGKRLNGFCALTSPDQLSKLWFAVARGQAPPDSVYVVINDRQLDKQYKSTPVSTKAPIAAKECLYSSPAIGGIPSRIDVSPDGRSLEIFHDPSSILAKKPLPGLNSEILTCRLKLDCTLTGTRPKSFVFSTREHRDTKAALIERGSDVAIKYESAADQRACKVEELESRLTR